MLTPVHDLLSQGVRVTRASRFARFLTGFAGLPLGRVEEADDEERLWGACVAPLTIFVRPPRPLKPSKIVWKESDSMSMSG